MAEEIESADLQAWISSQPSSKSLITKSTYCFFSDDIGQMLLAFVFGVSFLSPWNQAWKHKHMK